MNAFREKKLRFPNTAQHFATDDKAQWDPKATEDGSNRFENFKATHSIHIRCLRPHPEHAGHVII